MTSRRSGSLLKRNGRSQSARRRGRSVNDPHPEHPPSIPAEIWDGLTRDEQRDQALYDLRLLYEIGDQQTWVAATFNLKVMADIAREGGGLTRRRDDHVCVLPEEHPAAAIAEDDHVGPITDEDQVRTLVELAANGKHEEFCELARTLGVAMVEVDSLWKGTVERTRRPFGR